MTEQNGNQGDPQEPIENNAAAYVNRGAAYLKKDDYDRAITVFSKAIELDSNNMPAYVGRGVTYRCKGNYDHAITDFDKAIELAPSDKLAHRERGITYYSKKDYERAITDFNKAIRLGFKHFSCYAGRGLAYYHKGDYDHAITDFDKAIELDSNNTGAYAARGLAYYHKDDYDHAITDFDKAIELDSDNAGAYAARGIAYYWKNNNNSAFADFGKAVNLDPNLKSNTPYIYILSQLQEIDDSSLRTKSLKYCLDLLETVNQLKKSLLKQNIVTHYTSLGVLKKLLSDGQFRFYNATYMNDPEEGETFFAILNKEGSIDIKKKFYENPVDSYSPAYIGSFTEVKNLEKEDNLFLWRTYGKQENQEAGGACLVFYRSCFSENIPLGFGAMQMQEITSDSELPGFGAMQMQEITSNSEPPAKPCLYQVVYEQEEDNEREGIIQEMVNKLEQINTECLEEASNQAKELIRGLVRELLDEVRFLFKGEHYREEKEMRVVLMRYIPSGSTPPNSDIKEDTEHFPPRLYLDAPKGFHFDKVLLGPQATGLAEWRQWARLKQQGRGISIEKSKIPYKG